MNDLENLEYLFQNPLEGITPVWYQSQSAAENGLNDLLNCWGNIWQQNNRFFQKSLSIMNGNAFSLMIIDFKIFEPMIVEAFFSKHPSLFKWASIFTAACSISYKNDFIGVAESVLPILFLSMHKKNHIISVCSKLCIKSIYMNLVHAKILDFFCSINIEEIYNDPYVYLTALNYIMKKWPRRVFDSSSINQFHTIEKIYNILKFKSYTPKKSNPKLSHMNKTTKKMNSILVENDETIDDYLPPTSFELSKKLILCLDRIISENNFLSILGIEELIIFSIIKGYEYIPNANDWMKSIVYIIEKFSSEVFQIVPELIKKFEYHYAIIEIVLRLYSFDSLFDMYNNSEFVHLGDFVDLLYSIVLKNNKIIPTTEKYSQLSDLFDSMENNSKKTIIIEWFYSLPYVALKNIFCECKYLEFEVDYVSTLINSVQTINIDTLEIIFVDTISIYIVPDIDSNRKLLLFLNDLFMINHVFSMKRIIIPLIQINEKCPNREIQEIVGSIFSSLSKRVDFFVELIRLIDEETYSDIPLSNKKDRLNCLLNVITSIQPKVLHCSLAILTKMLKKHSKSSEISIRRLIVQIFTEIYRNHNNDFLEYFNKLNPGTQKLIIQYSTKNDTQCHS